MLTRLTRSTRFPEIPPQTLVIHFTEHFKDKAEPKRTLKGHERGHPGLTTTASLALGDHTRLRGSSELFSTRPDRSLLLSPNLVGSIRGPISILRSSV